MNEAANKQPPFAEFLGLKVTHVSPERVTAELVAREELNNRFGILHGGALMTADTVYVNGGGGWR